MTPRPSRSAISETYQHGEEAVITLVESLYDVIASLEARIAVLEGQQKKNSQNSSKPPSSDGLRRTMSLREVTGKKPGGQAKHEGRTLERVAEPDAIRVHAAPEVCSHCHTSLGSVVAEIAETRQVMDVPKVKMFTTEHRVERKRCPCCHAAATAVFPRNVHSSVQYGVRLSSLAVYLNIYHLLPRERTVEVLEELCGVSLSNGTIENMLARAFAATEGTETAIKEHLIIGDALSADETGARMNGKTQWIHVAATDTLTHYHASIHRGKEAHAETGILPAFAANGGVLHTDFYPSYHAYECRHAYCNAHLLRSLRFLGDVQGHLWAKELRTLLQGTLHQLKEYRYETQNALAVLSSEVFRGIAQRYDGLVEAALRLHPRATQRANGTTKGRIKQTEERLLLERFRDHKADILRFATDPCARFDNNLAERDLRMVKVQQKISGSFRSMDGAKVFCRLRGFCSTVRKNAANILDALVDAFNGYNFTFSVQMT
jgi:transposase